MNDIDVIQTKKTKHMRYRLALFLQIHKIILCIADMDEFMLKIKCYHTEYETLSHCTSYDTLILP